MCGIAAAVGPNAPNLVRMMMPMIAHRGVRCTTTDTKGGTLGHARLPIVGLDEKYDQPVASGVGLLAFVGQILDFRRWQPAAECDLDVVVQAWKDLGPGGFVSFDGFWSVVNVSHNLGLEMLCDYLGQKPLYYRTDISAACSEPLPLAMIAPVTPDMIYLSAVCKWGYCPEVQRTPFNEVKRVRPGHYVRIRHGLVMEDMLVDPLLPQPADLRTEIEAAVMRRVQSSDVPVAALVSGGLDSTIVYNLAQRYGDVTAYHVGTEELDAFKRVVGDRPHVVVQRGEEPGRNDVMLNWMQEPIDLGSLMPQARLARAVEETVCLTGDGADEFFGGYRRALHYDSQASDVWHELVAWHLPRLDRIMMQNRVEVRSPFLARKVAGAALALPRSGGRIGKKILRDIFADIVPREILEAPKIPLVAKEVRDNKQAVTWGMVEVFRRHWWG